MGRIRIKLPTRRAGYWRCGLCGRSYFARYAEEHLRRKHPETEEWLAAAGATVRKEQDVKKRKQGPAPAPERAPGPPATPVPDSGEFRFVALTALRESPCNPRRRFDETGLADLTQSIRERGVLVPLLVREVRGDDPGLEIVAGARRFRAAQGAGAETVPVVVREMSDDQALETQVIENLQREDVHPLEEAAGYRALMERMTYRAEDVAAKIGKSTSYVYQRLQLLKLVGPLQDLFLAGELTAGHAVELARLTEADQKRLLKSQRDGLFEDRYDSTRREVRSVRSLRTLIRSRYHLELGRAVWDLDDADLVKRAGSCTACQKRTGANRGLFPDIESADVCTDGACYDLKAERVVEAKRAAFEAKGKPVVLVTEQYVYEKRRAEALAKRGILFHGSLGEAGGWERAGKQACPHRAHGVVAEGRDAGQTFLVCTQPKTCRVHKPKPAPSWKPSPKQEAAARREERRREVVAATRKALFDEVMARVKAPLTDGQMRAVAQWGFGTVMAGDLFDLMGWEDSGSHSRRDDERRFNEHLAACDATGLARVILAMALGDDVECYHDGECLEACALDLGLDVKAIEVEARAAVRKKGGKEGTAKKGGKKGTKPTPGVCRVCGCTEANACPGGCAWANRSRTLCTRCDLERREAKAAAGAAPTPAG